MVAAAPAFGAEPLVGLWQMIYQQIGKSKVPPDPVAIRITEEKGLLRFEYLLHREMALQRAFTVRLDGEPGVIKDDKGVTLGIAKLSKTSATEYKLVFQRPYHPPEPGTLSLTDKGYVLHCETDGNVPGQGPSHITQVFAKQTAEQ
jgi:hypothetical protein